MSTALAFQSTTFDVINRNSQPWIRSAELAQALGYSSEKSVSNLYARNSDEFSNDMSVVINLSTGGMPSETRIFSLRGCYAIAMFARTAVAKAFRVWVLDVLDNHVGVVQPALDVTPSPLSQRSDIERKALTYMINVWVGLAPIHYAAARAMVNAHYGVAGVDSMTIEQVKTAIEWVQGKIDALTGVQRKPKAEAEPVEPKPKAAPKVALKARPEPKPKALPAAEIPYAVKAMETVVRLNSLRVEVFKASCEVREILSTPFHRERAPASGQHFAKAMNEATSAFFMAINNNMAAADDMFRAYVEAERMLNG